MRMTSEKFRPHHNHRLCVDRVLTATNPPRPRRRSEWEPIRRPHQRWAIGEEMVPHLRNVTECVASMFPVGLFCKKNQQSTASAVFQTDAKNIIVCDFVSNDWMFDGRLGDQHPCGATQRQHLSNTPPPRLAAEVRASPVTPERGAAAQGVAFGGGPQPGGRRPFVANLPQGQNIQPPKIRLHL